MKKILIIDDSTVVRTYIKTLLPKKDDTIYLEAKDGETGLKLIKEEKPSLVFLDYILPKLSGLEVYKQLVLNKYIDKLPLVIMSGRKEEVIEYIPEPFKHFSFIEKPFDKVQLLSKVKEAFTKCEVTRPKTDVEVLKLTLARLNQKIDTMQAEIDLLRLEVLSK
jgi:CheY-like chemotaxis protein